jgi:hypothetical protein
MGINLTSFKCASCGQMMSPNVGPNWTVIPGMGGDPVVVLSCLNVQCGQVLGVYTIPAK